MLKRKIDEYLLNWKNNRRTALLVKGVRQIGKTYSIENFIKSNFNHYIEINFAVRTDLISSFAQILNYNDLLMRLSLVDGENLVPNETVIFFDEIQVLYQKREELRERGLLSVDSQDILTAMKPLVLDGKFRFILSGSLLGTEIKNVVLNPLGFLDEYQMYPLDFEEFLLAKNVGESAIEYVKKCFKTIEKVDDDINEQFLRMFKEYLLIGGMPEAVDKYTKQNNLTDIANIEKQIVSQYTNDIVQYVNDNEKRIRIREIFKSIPSEIDSKNKRFIASHVIDKNYLKNNNLKDEYLWLTEAGIAIPVYNVTNPVIPLVLSCERKTLKLFLSDIGLLNSMLFSTGIMQKIMDEDSNINFGAPYENIVAQELYAHGFNEALFYYNSKKHGEVDFVVEYENDVLPIEIKSGKPNELRVYNHTALNNLIETYPIQRAFVFGQCNVTKESDVITQFPIYMIDFIRK